MRRFTLVAVLLAATLCSPAQRRSRKVPGTAAAPAAQITLSPASIAFGNVLETNLSTANVTMTNPGTTAVVVSAVSMTGSNQFVTTATWPVNDLPFTLAAGKSKELLVIFAPDAAGAATAAFTIAGAVLSVSGTGVALGPRYAIELNWDAPAGGGVAGYAVYRAAGSGAFVLLNSELLTATTFTDKTAVAGPLYTWEVVSVNSAGVQSAPSNLLTLVLP